MKLKGIVLNSIDYKEASKIVYLYTRLGKLSIKAVGANKPKNGLLGFTTAGNIVSFVASDSNFPVLSEYEIEKSMWINTDNLRLLEAIMVILRVIKQLPDDINHERTYNFLEDILKNINEENYKKALAVLLIKLTYSFGVAPRLKECTICGSRNNLMGFKVSTGGAICKDCGGGNPGLLNIWHQYYYDRRRINDYDSFEEISLFKAIDDYYRTHIHMNLKLGFIEK